MVRICIIPARGGSKRLPGKNIRDFNGKPIIAYSIEAAIQSGYFDHVLVSTDDVNIAEVAKKYKAEVPFMRSAKNSDDFATIADVVLEVLDFYKKTGIEVEEVACLFATAPFISSNRIEEAVTKLKTSHADSVFFIQEFNYPILRALQENKDGHLEMIWPEHLNSRSQDLSRSFHDAGMFYLAKRDSFEREHTFFTKKSVGIVLSDLEARDIDTETDWKVAEQLFILNRSR